MSDLATTLEQMQYDILQGDLSGNPYLQPNSIKSKDKELKTNAKKIIPAINELLKRLDVCETTVDGFTTEVDTKLSDFEKTLANTLTSAFREEMATTLEAMEAALTQKLEASYKAEMKERIKVLEEEILSHQTTNINTAVEEQLEALIAAGEIGNGEGGSNMKKVLAEKVTIAQGDSVTLQNITQDELFPENIIVYLADTLIEQPFYNLWSDTRHNQLSWSTSAEPCEIKSDANGQITIKNTASSISQTATVLIYKYA